MKTHITVRGGAKPVKTSMLSQGKSPFKTKVEEGLYLAGRIHAEIARCRGMSRAESRKLPKAKIAFEFPRDKGLYNRLTRLAGVVAKLHKVRTCQAENAVIVACLETALVSRGCMPMKAETA